LAGTPDYITLAGQVLTRNQIDLTADVTGVLPVANYATGTPDGTKFVRDDGTLQNIPGGGDALVANPLSQFAATTSSQLAGVISDETGSGALCFATSPTLVTPLLGTPTSGNLQNCTAATTTAKGVSELATAAEISAGTDTARTICPDELEASTYNWTGPTGIALSDETTALTASTSVPLATFHIQRAQTLVSTPFGVTTAPTGSTMTFDIHKNGTTIYSTKPTIDATAKTTATAATPAVISTTAFAAGDLVEVFVDAVGATIAGAGAKMYWNAKHPTS